MKLLLLFFPHSQHKRPGEFLLGGFVLCWSGICENRWMTLVRIYVSSYTKISNKEIKNLLPVNLKGTEQNPCEKQGLTNDLSKLFFSVFNADVQRLITGKAINVQPSCLTLKTSVALFSWRSLRPLNAYDKFPYYEQAHEHFYRLRSLFEHTRQWAHAQKPPEKELDLFRRIANYPFK